MAKLLIASLVDPATHPGGAGTYTRGWVAALRKGESGHEVELIDDFATQTPGEVLRRQFAPDGHVEKLNYFLSEIIQDRSR